MRQILGHLLISGTVLLVAPAVLGAATLQVGPGQIYAKPCAAIAAAAPGDTILIDAAGSYAGDVCQWFTNGLTIRGVNGRPHIDAAGNNAAGKGIWVIDGNNTVVENIELSGATVPDGNGAGIRFESYNLVVRGCYIHGNQDGLLTNNPGIGDILIEYSEFAYNGTGNGYTHNIYVGQQGTFTMRFSYSHHAYAGELVKTRAAENHITYNRLTTESGTTSYEIDIPNGGLSYVIGNVVQQGPNGLNSNVVDYMGEGMVAHNPDHRLFVSNNTFVNNKTYGNFILVYSGSTTPIVLQNNIFLGPGTITTQASAILTNNLINVDPLFVNPTAYDYHLRSGSPAIDAGIAPGLGAGQSLSADYDYVHPTCGETRAASGSVDLGAYEFGNVGSLLNCSTSTGTGATAITGILTTPNAVVAGGTSTASVQLSNPAPPGGIVVTMTSNNGSVASLPGLLAIPAGYSGGSVQITTGGVTTTTVAGISATYDGIKKTTSLAVAPPLALSAIAARNLTTTSVTITWTSNVTATSQVNYGATTAYGSSSAYNSTRVASHSVVLSGLVAGRLYHFRVVSKDIFGNQVVSGDYTFTTP